MKERPILIAVIGYIIGIIMGLYFNFSVVLFYVPIIVTYHVYKKIFKKNKVIKKRKFKLISLHRYFRYVKIFFDSKCIYIIIILSVISNSIVIFKNNQYEKIYSELSKKENLKLIGVIASNKEEKEYYDQYKLEIKYKKNSIKLYIRIENNETKQSFEYGDEVYLEGKYIEPEKQRNYKGFNYSEYLKQKKIYGSIKCEKIQIRQKNKCNIIIQKSNEIGEQIKEKIRILMSNDNSELLLGLTLGEISNIDQDIQQNFRKASIAHVLAISGMHVNYILIGINILLKNKLGKRITNIICILILIIYMFLTNFSPSITRAGVMGIIILVSKLIYRKSDMWTSISFSLLLILIYNPFLINNLGLQLSYGGTIGIIIFNKTILNILDRIKIKKLNYKITKNIRKMIQKIKEIISISLSVQIFIIPILILNLNTINPYFLISNLLLSIIIGPIIIINFLFIIIILINIKLAKNLVFISNMCIEILKEISKIGELPFSKIYVPTPKIQTIIIYYIILIILKNIYDIYISKNINNSQIRIKNLIALVKYKFYQDKRRKIFKILIIFLVFLLINFIPKDLKIYFIDVGQGDSTLIVTPENKTILIDGGGSETSNFDVGEKVILPYVLDRGYNKINTIIISHFDSDHIGGILTILKELKVGKVYIAKQGKQNHNYKKFIEIVKEKKINVITVEKGDKIEISKDIYFNVLWPKKEKITENIINNNSIVCKMNYKKFSMLFTGDIEEIAENKILEEYDNKILKSYILKISHHGSKTSTKEEFLKRINPTISIIGVGKNNMFGHPNDDVIERINEIGSKIYRTDKQGEITIKVNKKIQIDTLLK